jgi:periplasmic protein TonB
LLRAERAWFAAPGTDPSVRVRTGFAASCAAHLLLGIALTAAVWRAIPSEPAPVAVSVVFEAPAAQPAATAVQPGPEAPEPSQSEPPVQEPAAAVPPDSAEAPAAEPTPELAAAPPPDRVEQSVPVMPAPEPAPAPPSPPPPIVQAPSSPPPPVPHSKPPSKQIAARSLAAKPTSPPGPAPTAPAEPAASAAPTAAQSPSPAVAGWNTLFSAWLAARKTYPDAARQHGEQGIVTLRFRVAGDGTVLEVALVTGSGSPVLDEAARALLRDAKLPPPQAEISRTVRLRYRLDD